MKMNPWLIVASALALVPSVGQAGSAPPVANRSDEAYQAKKTAAEEKFRAGTTETEPDRDSS